MQECGRSPCARCDSATTLAAENLFLRKQLALYREHDIKPRRAPHTTQLALVWLSRWFDWRHVLAVVQPATLMRWHRQGFPKPCQSLPPDKQEVVLDFAEFLVCRQWPTSWAVAKRQEMVARTIIQRVGVIKVEEHISFADAFASALAERLHVPLMTTDHQEFDNVEQKGHFRFLW